jgi:hypothetical protein
MIQLHTIYALLKQKGAPNVDSLQELQMDAGKEGTVVYLVPREDRGECGRF